MGMYDIESQDELVGDISDEHMSCQWSSRQRKCHITFLQNGEDLLDAVCRAHFLGSFLSPVVSSCRECSCTNIPGYDFSPVGPSACRLVVQQMIGDTIAISSSIRSSSRDQYSPA